MDKRLIKYFTGRLNEKERIDFFEYLQKDKELLTDYIQLKNINSLVKLCDDPTDKEVGTAAYKNFKKSIDNKKRKKRKLITYCSYAASIIILFCISFLLIFTNKEETASSIVITYNTLYVPYGQRAYLELSDDVKIWINANTTLKYPTYFDKKQRRVELDGEAFFIVSKKNNSNFFVKSGDVETKVLGTTFNVKSYSGSDYTQVSLLKGCVEVSHNNSTYKLKDEQEVQIKENEVATIKLKSYDDFLWTKGIYAFQKSNLNTIISKLQLYYGVQIIIENEELQNIEYTGKFRQRDGIIEILKVLQKVHPFSFELDNEKEIITIK